MQIPNIYAWKNYKLLIVIPLILSLIALTFIPRINLGIDFRGGILITLQTNSTVNEEALENALEAGLGVQEVSIETSRTPLATGVEITIERNEKLANAEAAIKQFDAAYQEFVDADFRVTSLSAANNSDPAMLAEWEAKRTDARNRMQQNAQIVLDAAKEFVPGASLTATDAREMRTEVSDLFAQAKNEYKERVIQTLQGQISFEQFTYKEVSPTLSEFFIQRVVQIIVISMVLVMVVIFLVFRSPAPSLAVMSGAMNDIIFALGAMGLFGIPLTLASFATLMMIIGFALDTDILLTIRVLKRTENTAKERAYEAMKTGLTMNSAGIISFAILLTLSILTQLPTYYQISSVAIAGLVGDAIATWTTNAIIVLWYAEKKKVV